MIAHRRDYSRTLSTPGPIQPMSANDRAFANRNAPAKLAWWKRMMGGV